ncbi:MAG: SDR family oxidoreductase [Nocardiaceae bacterium]|nr:SDR family oxidoreductase [Nocardiaceae bacterium]
MKLAGKTVFITGAARGIGAEVARQCVAHDANVFLIGTSGDLLAQVAGELGEKAAFAEVDVTDLPAVEAAVETAAQHFGGIDVVLANAGITSYGTVATISKEAFERTMDVNVSGMWNTLSATLPHVTKSKGHVLTVCSVSSFVPGAGIHAYSASKAAAEMMTSCFALEVAYRGVTVGSVHPGWTDTAMVRDTAADLDSFVELRKRLPWPLHATISVEDCARAIVRGMRRRSSRVYAPGSMRLLYWGRGLIQSPLGLRINRILVGRIVQPMEEEVRALGRSMSTRAVQQLSKGHSK